MRELFALDLRATLLTSSSACCLFYVYHFLDVWNRRDMAFSGYTRHYRDIICYEKM